MTANGIAPTTAGRSRSRTLRFFFGALSGVSILTISALSLLLAASLLPRATELRQHMEPISYLFGALRDRMQLVAETVRDARRMVASETQGSAESIRRARAALAAASSRVAARQLVAAADVFRARYDLVIDTRDNLFDHRVRRQQRR